MTGYTRDNTQVGFFAPMRFEADITDCEVIGKIPSDLNGSFVRVGGEFLYPPKFPDDAPLNTDGYVSAFRFRNGGVSFKGRWVKTERYQKQVAAQRQLYGYYRNPFTDDDSVKDPANPNRRTVTRETRIKQPYVSLIHDIAVTQKHILLPFGGYVTSMERLKAGKIHWGWDQTKPSMIGVLPRDGEAKDVRWFKGPERCMMHTFNAYTEGNKIILYAPFWDSNFFPFFPPVDGSPWNPAKARAFIRKITLDLDKPGDSWQEEILWPTQVGDLGKVDPRVMSLETRYLYTLFGDDSRPVDRTHAPSGAMGKP